MNPSLPGGGADAVGWLSRKGCASTPSSARPAAVSPSTDGARPRGSAQSTTTYGNQRRRSSARNASPGRQMPMKHISRRTVTGLREAAQENPLQSGSSRPSPARASCSAWIVELQPQVRMWIAPWEGDPGRTCVESSAKRFKTVAAAKAALTRARRYSPFKEARIYDPTDRQ